MQARHSSHRQRQDGPVKHHVGHLHAYEEGQEIDASSRHLRVPGFPDGYALESPEEVVDEEPHEDEGGEKDDGAPERGRGEDATIEKEDGELDGRDGGAVELGGYIDRLSRFSSSSD